MIKGFQNILRTINISLLLLGYYGYANAQAFEANPADISPLLDFVGRTVNVLVSISGTVFSIMILWAAYKYAMARGDPKALLGAKHTLMLAMQGIIIVVGFYTIMMILGGAFGVSGSLINPMTQLKSGFSGFIKAINDCNAGNFASGCAGL